VLTHFVLHLCRVGLKTAPATRFVRATRTYYNQFVAFHQALRMHCGFPQRTQIASSLVISSAMASKPRHRLERPTTIVRIKTGHDHALAQIRQLRANIQNFLAQKLCFVNSPPLLFEAESFPGFPTPS